VGGVTGGSATVQDGGGGARFRSLVELLPVAVYVCEAPSGKITFYNAHAAKLWGREPRLGNDGEHYWGSHRVLLSDGTPLRHEDTPMARALREGRPARNEQVVIERADKSCITVNVDVDPIFDEAGRIVEAISVFYDTTSVRRSGEERARLAAIVESSDDAIISKDLNGIIMTWNAGAERLFGYSASEAVGQPVTLLIPPNRHNEEPEIIQRVRRGERVDHYETVRQSKDGSLLNISLSVSPIFDDRGNVTGASKIARDITASKLAAARIAELLQVAEQSREEAEAANRSKDEFLAMLGHELRNPLSAVRNSLVVVGLDEKQQRRALEIAQRAADQLSRIVDDLLDVARISQGRVLLRKSKISLNQILEQTLDSARGTMDERRHSLTLSLPPETAWLEADAARIEQAITNLLANAAKYTDPGGTVTVTLEQDGEHAVIRVRDTGIGIASEVLPRVFDLFSQAERSLDRAEGGLGIGLTLVRRIVELHAGTVEAKSPGVGGGAEFVLRLPAVFSSGGQVAVPKQHPRRPPHAARVLMLEDNADVAETLAMILELLGHHVRVVADGTAGLEAARANVPDIMLVDIGLPKLNGYEVAKAVRADATLKHVVLVALTGYGRAEDKSKAMAAGFDYHLTKPVDLEMLGEVVARLAPHDEVLTSSDTRH
jgi:two-component system, chemotaxis family, CheB/CheR fusion protein